MVAGQSASGHHLQITASVLAKQRCKAGEVSSDTGGKERVQSIDALLGAIRHRLQAVQEALAADMPAHASGEIHCRQIEAAEAAVGGGSTLLAFPNTGRRRQPMLQLGALRRLTTAARAPECAAPSGRAEPMFCLV